MSTTHSGNQLNQVTFEEHDGANNAKRVNVVAGGVGQATVTHVGMVTLAPSPNFIGLATVKIGTNVNTNIGLVTVDGGKIGVLGNVTLSNSQAYIGLVTATLGASPAFIGIVTVANPGAAAAGNVTLNPSPNFIGIVTVANPAAPAAGNVTLNPSPNFIGIVTVANASLPVTFAGNVTLDPGSRTGILGNVTLSDAKTYIGLTTTTLGASPAFVGIVTIANTNVRSIAGNVTLSDARTYIGLTTTTLGASVAGIGFATVRTAPPPISTYTSFATIFSATGNASLFAPPNGTRWVLKDLIVSSLGRAELNIKSGDKQLIPYISLSTTSGFHFPFGMEGLAAEAADDIFALTLNGGSTISILANVRFE